MPEFQKRENISSQPASEVLRRVTDVCLKVFRNNKRSCLIRNSLRNKKSEKTI